MFSLNLIKYQTYASQSVPTLSWTNPENVESACEFKSKNGKQVWWQFKFPTFLQGTRWHWTSRIKEKVGWVNMLKNLEPKVYLETQPNFLE